MNVICYVNTLSFGGAERVMSVLASGLAERGHKVILVTDYSTEKEYPLSKCVHRIVLDGVFNGTKKSNGLKRTLRRIGRLRQICKKEQAEALISFMSLANARGILATRGTKTKCVISVRNDPKVSYSSKGTKLIAKCLYPLIDGCIFQTDEAQAWFAPKIQKKSRIIFNPISDTFFKTEPAPMTEKRIVTCGRLHRQKRFDLQIEAFHKICDDFPEYTLEIYGMGDLQSELQAQIDDLGRQNRIKLMGRSEDVPGAIKTASLFVMSSDFEGLPNALMEAMVLGLPVISTDCGGGGARALIEDGVDGRIVPCGDVDALAEAMRNSLANPEKAKMRGEKAAEKAKGFSTEQIIAKWEDYIRHLVAGEV